MTKRRVLVLGGGVTGLTVAHECQEAGAEVILCEKDSHWGGKVLAYRLGAGSLAPGAPVEHSMRTYHSSYFSLFETMRRIPRASGSVFNTLSPVAASTLIDGGRNRARRSIRIDSSLAYPAWRRSIDLCRAMRLFGVPWSDIFAWSIIVGRYILGGESHRKRVAALRVDEYLQLDRRSEALATFVLSMADIVFAAKRDASAAVVIDLFVRVVLVRHGTANEMISMTNVTNGPVNECFIDPWVAHLKRMGVEMRARACAVAVEWRGDGDERAPVAVRFDDGSRIEADAFVFAVTPSAMASLLPDFYATSTLPSMRREWSVGVQFFCRRFPDNLAPRDAFSLLVGSPWAIIYMIEAPPLWRGVEMPPQMEGVLSVTVSSFDTPGVVHGKTFWQCSWEEVQDEILAQIGVVAHDLILGAHMDPTVRRMPEAEFLAGRNGEYRDWQVSPATDGHVWTLAAPLWIFGPETSFAGMPVKTDYPNVFVGGEFTGTHTKQPTMEKASQAGKLCAAAVLEALGLNYDRSRLERPLSSAFARWLYR
jgi:uncharacterized protein with NAD-binding domain and iron-sulfur cluster